MSTRPPRIATSEILDRMDFSILRYSLVWEDLDLLTQGLAIQPGESVLSVGSAGDNVLGLLLADPGHITAIDLSPAQQAWLALKLAALGGLSHADFVALLGFRPHADRAGLYRQVRAALALPHRTYWDQRPGLIAAGIAGTGRLERFFAEGRRQVLHAGLPAEALADFLDLDDQAAQVAFFDRWWGSPAFAEAFTQYYGRDNLARHGRDPVQFAYVTEDPGGFFYQRFRWVCTQLPVRGNPYLEAFLTGGYRDLTLAPAYLQPAHYPTLQARASRVQLVTQDLEGYLRRCPAGQYDKGNFSDLFEYLSPANARRLFRALARALRPGGRLAYWNLLVARQGSALVPSHLRYRPESAALYAQDRSWFYGDFRVEEVG